MNAMEKLAAQENKRAKATWDRTALRRNKLNKEVKLIFRPTEAVKKIRMKEIIRVICDETGVTSDEILKHDRSTHLVRVRQYAMWKCREQGYSYTVIGRTFKRDHSTIMHACKKIDELMKGNK